MGKPTGFAEIRVRTAATRRSPSVSPFDEFLMPLATTNLAARRAAWIVAFPFVTRVVRSTTSLQIGTIWFIRRLPPGSGCAALHQQFSEFTGRICPAPCEAACTLNITDEPVSIKSIECAIVDRGWEEGPAPGLRRSTGKRVAIVGSGPTGLACAQQLARAGHRVLVFEKNIKVGGLLRYGIPDLLAKSLIDRRMGQMQAEGVVFRTNSHVVRCEPHEPSNKFDAVASRAGPNNRAISPSRAASWTASISPCGSNPTEPPRFRRANHRQLRDPSENKHVIVIGGGDTGSDCVGTSIRQGAASVTQMEIMQSRRRRRTGTTWPNWPLKLRTSSSQDEGCGDWSVATKSFEGRTARSQP